MKNRKAIFIGLVALALVLTTGTFAYGYMGQATGTLNADISAQPWVTSNVSADQPDWDSLLPQNWYNSAIIRPAAAGDENGLDDYPSSGQNWEKVDEATPDGFTTYVYNTSTHSHEDLYQLGDLDSVAAVVSIWVGEKINFGTYSIFENFF